MTLTPWKLWDTRTGEPAHDAATLEALHVVETALSQRKARAHVSACRPAAHAHSSAGNVAPPGRGTRFGRLARRRFSRCRTSRTHAVPRLRAVRPLSSCRRRQRPRHRRRPEVPGVRGCGDVLHDFHLPRPPHDDVRGDDGGPPRPRAGGGGGNVRAAHPGPSRHPEAPHGGHARGLLLDQDARPGALRTVEGDPRPGATLRSGSLLRHDGDASLRARPGVMRRSGTRRRRKRNVPPLRRR